VWTTRTVLAATRDLLAKRGIDEARLDAEHLLAHVLSVRRIDLFADHDRPLAEAELARYRALVMKRANERLPVAYLTGRREFYSLELEVTRDVLVPRPETELLVDVAIEALARRAKERPQAEPAVVADLGTGSGAIAIALAKLAKPPVGRVFAVEKSEAAAEVARRNVARHELGDRIEVLIGEWFAPLRARSLEGKLALIASNPPYVGEGERAALAPEVLAEPPGALFAGGDGLDAIRAICAEGADFLEPGGALAVEHGAAQGEAAREIARAAGLAEISTRRDLAGHERVLVARRGRPS
jgi:release factor glutamine methyltransferase